MAHRLTDRYHKKDFKDKIKDEQSNCNLPPQKALTTDQQQADGPPFDYTQGKKDTSTNIMKEVALCT